MSKNKETKLEKDFEKAMFEKNIKYELKEKPEKLEKNEKREIPEWGKKIFEKSPKEFVEGGQIPGINVFRAEKPEEGAAQKPEELKQKEIEKIKPEKEFPDKLYKEIEKVKPEKEFEKFQKEIEKIKPEKELFHEKFQTKPEFEKPSAETKLDPGTRLFKGVGNPEDRIAELENVVERLTHFIGVDLRPDLTTGALKGEPDVASGEAKPDDKKKPK